MESDDGKLHPRFELKVTQFANRHKQGPNERLALPYCKKYVHNVALLNVSELYRAQLYKAWAQFHRAA